MAQTRATSRALRGPLGFIVSLAGYQAAAAEEMPAGVEGGSSGASTRTSTAEAGTTQPAQEAGPPSTTSSLLSDHQQKSLHAQGKRKGLTHQDLHDIAGRDFGVESMTELTKQQANELMKMLNEYPDADPVVGGKEGHDG